MTVRPRRPGDESADVGELFDRMRRQERIAEGPWIYVGSGDPLPDQDGVAPAFQNGWSNVGGTKQTLRFAWLLAGGVKIQGSITGGANGTVVFTLPPGPFYRPDDGDVVRPATDDANAYAPYLIQTNGDVIRL